jgi:hypothetical protein
MKAIQYTGSNINAVISFAGRNVYLESPDKELDPGKRRYMVKTSAGPQPLSKREYIIYHEGDFSVVREDVFKAMQTFGDACKRVPGQPEREYARMYNNQIIHGFTKIYEDYGYKFGAPHHFRVVTRDHENSEELLSEIHFQEGPVNEAGVNGVMNEDLIAMVIRRLECFNRGPYSCRENDKAIEKLEEAMMWLNKRTVDRRKRKVEGTHKV